MEDTEFARDETREEVKELLESAGIDESEIVVKEDDKDSENGDNDFDIEEGELTDVTPDIINELSQQIA